MVRWMTAARPWFQIVDVDGDQRLTGKELNDIGNVLRQLDDDLDLVLTPNELPLLVRMELRRTDNRLNLGNLGIPDSNSDEPDMDWFSAMDTNRDGFIAGSEFLGETEDFATLDEDKDGFLARSEVY